MVIPPLAPLALLWMLAAGAFTVYLYQRRRPGLLPLGAGARKGATAGFVCFVIVIVLSGIAGAILLATMSGPELHKALQDQLQQALARTSDPQVRQTMQGFLTPAGLMLAVVTLFFSLIVFGGLGGLLGSVVMGRKPSR
jgi:glycerol uptake facilitator-like aquaporin